MFVIKNKKYNNYYKGTVGKQFHWVFNMSEAYRFKNMHMVEVRLKGMENLKEYPNLEVVKVSK